MMEQAPVVSSAFEVTFLVMQGAVALFLLLHDWVPLGRLNNFRAMQREDRVGRRAFVTLLPGVPATWGLVACWRYFGMAYPHWLSLLLWITYGVLVVGMLRAWWVPYLLVPDPERAARYDLIFQGTHRFLPRRNGMTPDTLHTVFHLVTLGTLLLLFLRDRIVGSAA